MFAMSERGTFLRLKSTRTETKIPILIQSDTDEIYDNENPAVLTCSDTNPGGIHYG